MRIGRLSSDMAVLLVAFLVPVLGFLLEVIDSGRHVAFRFWQDVPFPDVCLSRVCFNWQCPGCGLTRSVVHLMHGRWEASLGSHRLGWFVLALIVSQIPYRLWRLWKVSRNSGDFSAATPRMAVEETATFSGMARSGSDADAVA